MRIWKYELDIDDVQAIEMPVGVTPLSVAAQGNALCVWVAVPDPVPVAQDRVWFRVVGTGNPAPPDPGRFLGTVVMYPFVWHVFVEVPAGFDVWPGSTLCAGEERKAHGE